MRLLFIRPPKYLWPYMNEQDNYLLPQAAAWLAGATRAAGHDVHVLDCMAEKVGWAGVGQRIRDLKPDAVLAGDSETLYERESGRVFTVCRSIDPKIVTIAGGTHFTHASEHAFDNYPIDLIVRGEGEATLVRALAAIEAGKNLRSVPGLALPENGGAYYTEPAPLVEDLDSLAPPAYDLMPMDKYGTARYLFSPGGASIHHSRGCLDCCAYCACWLQMARRDGIAPAETLAPRWRTRSVEPVVDEMELLARKYGKTCLVFVDDTWNVDARWNQEFATTLRRRDLGVVWFGFMRADLIERDEETGVFAELIASGLTHICIGLERTDDAEIEGLQKHRIKASHYHELVTRLRRRYPSLFLQTTFLVGLRTDTPERLDRLLAEVDRLDPDYPAFHPLTPVPGTALWKEANENGWLEIRDFAQYDWMTPVMGTETMSREELELKLWEMNRKYMGVTRVLRGVLSRHTYRRRMYLWWLTVTLRVLVDFATDRVFPSRSVRGKVAISEYIGLLKPDWYDS